MDSHKSKEGQQLHYQDQVVSHQARLIMIKVVSLLSFLALLEVEARQQFLFTAACTESSWTFSALMTNKGYALIVWVLSIRTIALTSSHRS